MTKANGSKEIPKGANGITCAPLVATTALSSPTHFSIDTLVLNLFLNWFHHDFKELLDSKRLMAQELDVEGVTVDFARSTWLVHRNAPSYFRYHLSSGDVHIFLSNHQPDSNFPNCKIEIGSLSSWSGCFSVVTNLKEMLTTHGCTIEKEIVSRVDLAVDLVGTDIKELKVDNEDYWICKATKFALFREHRKLTGITYGKGNLMLRIYDKVQELKQKQSTAKQAEFKKIWGLKSYDEKPVTRTEFQFRREVLAQFANGEKQINTFSELNDNIQALWDYCCSTWARHNSEAVDRENKHQDRSVFSEFWEKVSSVDWGTVSLMKRSVKKVRKNIGALREQMRGIAVTLASSTGLHCDDYFNIQSVASQMLSEELHKYMTEKYVEFTRKYQQRQVECLTAINY